MTCYSNASIDSPSNALLFQNLTLQACQCFLTQENVSAFQYNTNERSCYIFDNEPSLSDIRINLNSRVCFLDQPLSKAIITLNTSTSLLSAVTTSTSVTGSNWYTADTLYLINTVSLTALFIVITVPKNLGVMNGTSYTTFSSNAVNNTINDTNTSIIYTFTINSGQTIAAGLWIITAQFYLNGQARSSSNDTYMVQTESSQNILGHF